VLEDLAALVRLPGLLKRVTKVLERSCAVFKLPDDSPFMLVDSRPGDGLLDWGYRWMDRNNLVMVFLGMSWGDRGDDPVWEVRVETSNKTVAEVLRAGGLHRLAARRAESRFSDWGKFWHEDLAETEVLLGTSAAVTRFFEEDNAEKMAAEFLAAAFYSLHISGVLQALLEVAHQHAGTGIGPTPSDG